MTKQFQVSASGTSFGVFAAEDEQGARDACAVDAGYGSEAEMADALERPSDLVATECASNERLFNIMDGAIENDYANDILSAPQNVIDYAFNGCDTDITEDEAERIITVANWWLNEREEGNGEWSRIRGEAKEMLGAAQQPS